jgi:hypothetical protein
MKRRLGVVGENFLIAMVYLSARLNVPLVILSPALWFCS